MPGSGGETPPRQPAGRRRYGSGSDFRRYGSERRRYDGHLEEVQGGAGFAFYLGEGALAGGFFGAPAEELGAVAEAASGEVIELDFDDEFGIEGLPFGGAFCAPATGASGSFAGEARRLDQLL